MRYLPCAWVAVAVSAFAHAPAYAYQPGTGIAGTPHDWTSLNGTTKARIGLCTTCHTPMQAKSTNLLWNPTLTTSMYSWDQPATTSGTRYPAIKGDSYRGPTAKCLTCHDGTLASTHGAWFNRGTLTQSAGAASSAGNMSGTHPVAMPYPYNGASNTYNSVVNGSQTIFAEFVGDPTGSGIRLFNDDGAGNITAGAIAGKSGMECTSCHDVHNGSQVKDQLLLRGALAGGKAEGYLCTKCHNK